MKAITLHQPWATAMAIGLKTIETRHWQPRFRGRFAIHAAAGKHRYAREHWDFIQRVYPTDFEVFEREGYCEFDDLPFGQVVALGTLSVCVPTRIINTDRLKREARWGNYEPERFAWMFSGVNRLLDPIEAKGRQSLWNWNPPENEIATFPASECIAHQT